jgi:predicted transcriptional regulator
VVELAPEHSRAARGWLGWSQTDLARRAKVSLSPVRAFETGKRSPITNNLQAMRRAMEESGVELVFDEQGRPAGILVRRAAHD